MCGIAIGSAVAVAAGVAIGSAVALAMSRSRIPGGTIVSGKVPQNENEVKQVNLQTAAMHPTQNTELDRHKGTSMLV